MKKLNWYFLIGVFGLFLLSSCETDDEETGANTKTIVLTVEDLEPGSFNLLWDEVSDASWYFITITKDGEYISDTYDGTSGRQTGLIENGVAKVKIHRDVKAGEEYEITVSATDYLMGGEDIAKGEKTVIMPNLPEAIIGTWTQNNSAGSSWTFGADGTFTRSDMGDSYTMTWTIESGELVITKHFESNKQYDKYTYQLSDGGQSLSLDNAYTGMEYVLQKDE